MELFVIVAVAGAIIGGACSILVSNKNRDVFGWFVLGFLFNLVALIVIAALTPREKNELVTNPGPREKSGDQERDELRQKATDLAAALAQSRAQLNK